jgi:hypothetical protein
MPTSDWLEAWDLSKNAQDAVFLQRLGQETCRPAAREFVSALRSAEMYTIGTFARLVMCFSRS